MKLRLLVSACLLPLLLVGRPGRAADASRELSKIDVFAVGGVGVSGATSRGERLFREVLARPDAAAVFREWIETGTPGAKCYALLGLRALGEKLPPRPEGDTAEVTEVAGCALVRQPMKAIVTRIESGNYDAFLRSLKESR